MGVKAELLKSIHDKYTGVEKSYDISKETISKMLSIIYAPGPSFYAIFDFMTKRVEYVSNGILNVLGTDANTSSMDEIMELLHEEDVKHMKNCQELIEYFTNDVLNTEAKPYYKRTFQYRMKHAVGVYKLLLHQSMLIYNSKKKFLGKSFILISDISRFSKTRNDGVSFIDNRGHRSYHNITSVNQLYKLTKPFNELSEREIQILRMIAKGHKSKEIASILEITYDTVRTHRNNILKRQEFNNISQAMAYYLRKGVL